MSITAHLTTSRLEYIIWNKPDSYSQAMVTHIWLKLSNLLSLQGYICVFHGHIVHTWRDGDTAFKNPAILYSSCFLSQHQLETYPWIRFTFSWVCNMACSGPQPCLGSQLGEGFQYCHSSQGLWSSSSVLKVSVTVVVSMRHGWHSYCSTHKVKLLGHSHIPPQPQI